MREEEKRPKRVFSSSKGQVMATRTLVCSKMRKEQNSKRIIMLRDPVGANRREERGEWVLGMLASFNVRI